MRDLLQAKSDIRDIREQRRNNGGKTKKGSEATLAEQEADAEAKTAAMAARKALLQQHKDQASAKKDNAAQLRAFRATSRGANALAADKAERKQRAHSGLSRAKAKVSAMHTLMGRSKALVKMHSVNGPADEGGKGEDVERTAKQGALQLPADSGGSGGPEGEARKAKRPAGAQRKHMKAVDREAAARDARLLDAVARSYAPGSTKAIESSVEATLCRVRGNVGGARTELRLRLRRRHREQRERWKRIEARNSAAERERLRALGMGENRQKVARPRPRFESGATSSLLPPQPQQPRHGGAVGVLGADDAEGGCLASALRRPCTIMTPPTTVQLAAQRRVDAARRQREIEAAWDAHIGANTSEERGKRRRAAMQAAAQLRVRQVRWLLALALVRTRTSVLMPMRNTLAARKRARFLWGPAAAARVILLWYRQCRAAVRARAEALALAILSRALRGQLAEWRLRYKEAQVPIILDFYYDLLEARENKGMSGARKQMRRFREGVCTVQRMYRRAMVRRRAMHVLLRAQFQRAEDEQVDALVQNRAKQEEARFHAAHRPGSPAQQQQQPPPQTQTQTQSAAVFAGAQPPSLAVGELRAQIRRVPAIVADYVLWHEVTLGAFARLKRHLAMLAAVRARHETKSPSRPFRVLLTAKQLHHLLLLARDMKESDVPAEYRDGRRRVWAGWRSDVGDDGGETYVSMV